MKPLSLLHALVVALAVVMIAIVGCESKTPSGEAEQAKTEEAGDSKEAATDGAAKDTPEAGAETAIMAPAGSPGRMENDEGVSHYQQGHYDVAEVHFRKAIEADPNLAVAHFNLALALDKLNQHGKATDHFKKALELAPNDPQIAQSKILNAHVKM